MYEQYIQQLLTAIPANPFHGPARNMISDLEISSKIIHGLLAANETGGKLHLEFIKNRVTFHNTTFFETNKKSGITYKEEEKKTTKTMSLLKKDRQTLEFFLSKYTDYPFTSYPLAIVDSSRKLYQPTAKHLFRNELFNLSYDLIEKNPPKNAVHFYDGMTIVRSFACQKVWGDLWRLLLI